ncbi:hypothetical protein [Oceaniglobus trochenteri]|uniref:hypothetical protein n=1 Tax=Oceaniglobus trochenteri TaxID=2763260 RepID=UPI001CFF58DA|nr:hypothetical protein [Oceaniglobus trochenteri]
MSGASQRRFDHAEDIMDALNNAEGIERALLTLLEPHLDRTPDRGRAVFSLFEANGLFRRRAQDVARAMARDEFGETP